MQHLIALEKSSICVSAVASSSQSSGLEVSMLSLTAWPARKSPTKWVAVKELKFSYHNPEITFFTNTYP